MLDAAEELVSGGEARVLAGGEQLFVAETGEGEHRAAVAHPGHAAAVQALQALHEELDVADAAGGELNVESAAGAAGGHLLADALAGFGDGLDGAEVEGALVYEGLDEIEETLAGGAVAGGDARFNEHLLLPISGALRVVGAGAVFGDADLAARAVGAEAKVDAVALAVGGVGGEERGGLVGDLLIELLVADGGGSVGIAVALVEEHEIDVGAVIQLAAAEFAEGDDGEAAGGAVVEQRL